MTKRRIAVHFEEDEIANIKIVAAQYGLDRATYVRMAVLERMRRDHQDEPSHTK